MFRKRGDNLHVIYIFLFLTVAFFLLEHQDEDRFAQLFHFDGGLFAEGHWWRLLTYQFTQAGEGSPLIPKPVFLFFTLLILYFMGSALEEEWGTVGFVTFFLISAVATAGLAAWLGVPILGSFFVRYTLLFAYASVFPEQTFFVFAVIPVRVRWLAYLTAGVLVYGVFFGAASNIAVAGGAAAAYVYFLLSRQPLGFVRQVTARPAAVPPPVSDTSTFTAARNATRFREIRKQLDSGDGAELDRLVGTIEKDIVPGVNICPPADYKPEGADGYCLRCEGFSECSVRYVRLNRKLAAAPAQAVPEATP